MGVSQAPGPPVERLFALWGAGIEGWGWCSKDPGRLAMHLMGGVPGWSYNESSNDAADVLLNSKLIVLWGFEPTINHFGPGHQLAYYLKMARERGTPVICIEPRYTVAAEVLADQWIPIKPGTDAAMMLAIGFLLMSKNLYDREYVQKYVDPRGFEEWRSYLLGEKDGIPKTPEWAEKICGVPAETIRGFTDLYARTKPTWLWLGWGPPRKSRGENAVRAACALQAITGNWGVAGGLVPIDMGTRAKPARMLPYGEIPKVRVPKMYRSHQWAQMVLLKEKVDSGEMSADEYKAIIGWRPPNDPPPSTPQTLMGGGTPGYGGFVNITYVPGVVESPGEAKPAHWIHTEIVRRLGIGEVYNTYCEEGGDWWEGWEKYLRNEFDRMAEELDAQGAKTPTWEEFKKDGLINVQEQNEEPFHAYTEFIDHGKPLRTKTGKIELYSYVIGDESQRGQFPLDDDGRIIDNLPNDWRD